MAEVIIKRIIKNQYLPLPPCCLFMFPFMLEIFPFSSILAILEMEPSSRISKMVPSLDIL